MAKNSLQIDKFLIYDPEKSQSTGNVFVSHPTPVEEETFGQLLIITDIRSQDRINQDIINTIQEEIKKNYYQSSDLNIATAFENALQKTNDRLHQLIQDGLANWVDKLNIIVAIIKGHELHLTPVGDIRAYLIHGPKIVDILEASSTPAELEINPLKIFSNIVSGQLAEGDYLLFCTNSLLDFISLEKLKRTISGSRPQDAAAYIENLLIDTNQKNTFAALIVQLTGQKEAEKEYMPLSLKHPQYSAPQVSMEEMHDREKQTSELLTPSLWPFVKKGLLNNYYKAKGFINEKVLNKKGAKPYPEKIRPALPPQYKETEKRNIVLTILNFLWRLVKGLFGLLGKLMLAIFNFFKNWQQSRQKIKNFPDLVAVKIATGIQKYLGLPKPRKILLIVAFILIFGFAQSIVSLGESKEKEKVVTEYSQIISDIEQKQGEIDAALIYGDDQKASQLLSEARNLLSQLPDKKYQDKINQFNQSLSARADKINHVVQIAEPTAIFDFATAEEGAAVRGMVLIGDKIFSFNPNNNSVYSYDLVTKESKVSTNQIEQTGNLQFKATPEDNKYIVFYTNADKIVRFSLTNSQLEERAITYANQDKMIKAIEAYAGRLYLLDTKNQQIFRHNPTAEGYSTGQSWLKDELDLSDASAITVDGNIYLLKTNGEIWKLSAGAKVEFTIASFEPAFSNPSAIYTKAESEKIYVLDPENKRLVVINKNGKLLNQYRSDQFDGLKDFTLSKDEKTIYLLNKTKLLSISQE